MSPLRHEPAVRSYAVTHPPGTVVPPQPAGWDQVVYAAEGVVTVGTRAGRWVAAATRAVWVPDGFDHRIEVSGRAAVRNLYLEPGVVGLGDVPRVLDVDPLARELLLEVVRRAPVERGRTAAWRLVEVLADELVALPEAPLHLPMPVDDRARQVADSLLAAPGGEATLDDLAAGAGASRRTIERRFLAETGMPLAAWRRHARVLHALRLLAAGATTAQVAAAVGYSTPSAFVAAFRLVLGTTPQRWQARSTAAPARAAVSAVTRR